MYSEYSNVNFPVSLFVDFVACIEKFMLPVLL